MMPSYHLNHFVAQTLMWTGNVIWDTKAFNSILTGNGISEKEFSNGYYWTVETFPLVSQTEFAKKLKYKLIRTKP